MTDNMKTEKHIIYDIVIVGAGPAGLTAGIYAARYKMETVIIGPNIGGTANLAHDVENWPGFKGPGMELMDRFKEHAKSLGVDMMETDVKKIDKTSEGFTVSTDNTIIKAKSLILAMGTERRKLGVPGEDEFFGKGVSYCATCDCAFFKDQVIAVVGGSNAAATGGQIMCEHAKKVYIIYRGDTMRAETARVEELEKNSKVEFIYNANVVEITGDDRMRKINLDNGKEIDLDGLFIEIGGVPVTGVAKELGVELTESKKIKVDAGMKTNIKGVFAAGDVSTGSNQFNQIITAASEGAIAALGAFNFLKSIDTRSN